MIVGDQHPLRHAQAWRRSLCGGSMRRAWLLLVLLMTLPIAPGRTAGDDPLVLTGPADVEALGRHFEYTTDPAWQLTIADFAGPEGVATQPLPGAIPDFGYTAARIWLTLPVLNATEGVRAWRFFVHANFTQRIAVHKIAGDGTVTTLLDLTEDSPFAARPIRDPQMVAPFELAPGETAQLVVAYYSQGASRLSMSIETPESFEAQARLAQAKSYAFYGMMAVMIALATVALVVLRQPVFAAYAGYLSSIFVYIAHADGTAFQYIWPAFPRFNSMASVVAGSGVMVFGALFAMAFLQTARFHPVMHRVLQAVVFCVVAVDVVLWFADPQLLKRLLVQMISLSVLIFLLAGLVAARTRFREVRFYVFAWFAGLIPAIMFTSRFAFGLETALLAPYDAIRLALVFDALMMGLAIFDRYNHLRRAATEETLAETRRNLALTRRLALLEESYQRIESDARQREESVKDAVHDLRQPMHALRLSLRRMLGEESGKGADAGHVEAALSYMETLVADRLAERPGAHAPAHGTVGNGAASRGSGEGVAREAEPGFHAVLTGIADMFAAEAAAKGLSLRLVLAAPDARVAAYPLMRVVANLVSNAIKYTGEGRIVIALRRHGDGRRVEVHDTGPGLSGAAFEEALVRHQRLERDRDAAEGSGLGLSVVREIAEANHWRLTACDRRRTGASLRIAILGDAAGAEPPAPVAVAEAALH